MTSTTTPTATWQLIAPPKARDGDSMYLVREREVFRDHDQILIQRDPKPVLCRAAWIDTPEISGPNVDRINGPLATGDAWLWFNTRWLPGGLIAVQYGFEKYGRPLVDIRTTGGESFSQWMLRWAKDGEGWPAYA